MIASSYAGRVHEVLTGTATAMRVLCPRAASSTAHSTDGTSAGPRNVSAPGIASTGRAPTATSRKS